MSTEVYGASDDLIELEGDIDGEATAAPGKSLLIFDDGTILLIGYGKAELGIWEIGVIQAGTLFGHIDECLDEDADRYSDTAHFRDGLKFVYHAAKWERIK